MEDEWWLRQQNEAEAWNGDAQDTEGRGEVRDYKQKGELEVWE